MNPSSVCCIMARPLLHVLDLFTDPLQFRFELNDLTRDGHIISLGSDRIDFPEHLLCKKIKRPPGGLGRPTELFERISRMSAAFCSAAHATGVEPSFALA